MKLFSVTSTLVAVDPSTAPTCQNQPWPGALAEIRTYLRSTIESYIATLVSTTPADSNATQLDIFEHQHPAAASIEIIVVFFRPINFWCVVGHEWTRRRVSLHILTGHESRKGSQMTVLKIMTSKLFGVKEPRSFYESKQSHLTQQLGPRSY